jgi:nicotinamide riboside transporter PnuC
MMMGVIPVNLVVALWWLSGIISFGVLCFAIFAKSWGLSLISAALFLPIACYFAGAENAFRLIGLFPLVPVILACLFFWRKNQQRNQT